MLNRSKLFVLVLVLTGVLIAGCSNDDSKTDVTSKTSETTAGVQDTTAAGNNLPAETSSPETSASVKESTAASSEAAGTTITNDNISAKTKDYILAGQGDKPDADKIQWSETFLNLVNIDAVYQEYLSDSGTADDIPGFAQYLTLHAPIPDNWQDLTAADLLKAYDEKISYVELISDDMYQVYVTIEGADVPYVAVNARTGYYHG